jgi:hypothetical protein
MFERDVAVAARKVNWILNAEIRSFFDEVRQDWLIQFTKHGADPRHIRLIPKWLRASILEEGAGDG